MDGQILIALATFCLILTVAVGTAIYKLHKSQCERLERGTKKIDRLGNAIVILSTYIDDLGEKNHNKRTDAERRVKAALAGSNNV